MNDLTFIRIPSHNRTLVTLSSLKRGLLGVHPKFTLLLFRPVTFQAMLRQYRRNILLEINGGVGGYNGQQSGQGGSQRIHGRKIMDPTLWLFSVRTHSRTAITSQGVFKSTPIARSTANAPLPLSHYRVWISK